jgi:hypothetical protein
MIICNGYFTSQNITEPCKAMLLYTSGYRALYINLKTKELEASEKKTEEENFCTTIDSLTGSMSASSCDSKRNSKGCVFAQRYIPIYFKQNISHTEALI